MLLKVTERNWGLAGPGDWEKRSWKIDADGTYLLKTIYHPVDPGDTESVGETEEGELSAEQMEALREYIDAYWPDEKTDICDGNPWEFKLYDIDTVIRHRELGYICGIEPYESIAALLTEL